MASRFALGLVLLVCAAAGCGDMGNSEMLGALTGASGGSGGVVRCEPGCGTGSHCEDGTCVEGERDCEDFCDPAACLTCDQDFDPPLCVSLCDGLSCQRCDGDGRCGASCDASQQHCVFGECRPRDEGACENEADRPVLIDNQELDLSSTSVSCALRDCGHEVACLVGCIVDGRPAGDGVDEIAPTALSESCAYCYALVTLCAYDECAGVCFGTPNAAVCQTCLGRNCSPDFCACAGQSFCVH